MDPQSFGVDFCGPYISGGKFQSSVCSTHTARSAEEQCCKEHDCCYVHAGTPSEYSTCDVDFVNCNAPLNSWQSSFNSGLVNTFGKYFHGSNKMKRPRALSAFSYDTSPTLPPYGAPRFWDDAVINDRVTYGTPMYNSQTPDRPIMRRLPGAPVRSKRRLNLSADDANSLRSNLYGLFDLQSDRFVRGRRRRFSRLPRFHRRRIARAAQRRWRVAYARKKRLTWRNRRYGRMVSSASKIQRSFRKFLWRKKLRRNSFKRIRFIASNGKLSRYYKY